VSLSLSRLDLASQHKQRRQKGKHRAVAAAHGEVFEREMGFALPTCEV
jgi:hypothetical protein